LDRFIQYWVISAEVGSRKPDEEIYRALIEQTGRKPDEIVLFDDRQTNVDAARACGLEAELFVDAMQVAQYLQVDSPADA